MLPLDSSFSSTIVHDIIEFAKILADLERDAIPTAQRNFETTANKEKTLGLNFCETDETSNRLIGKLCLSATALLIYPDKT